MFDPMSAGLAVRLTDQHATSAQPHAPVVPAGPERAPRAATTRTRIAADLRSFARWVEPKPRRSCQPG